MPREARFRLMGWGQVRKVIDAADVVIKVLDIRDPLSTFSARVAKIASSMGKPMVLALNKCDLVPRDVAEAWRDFFERRGYTAVYVSATKHLGTLRLRRAVKRAAPRLPATAAVVGFPKTGKSSIINALKGRHSAPTSPYPGSPGYTRGLQLVRVDKNLLLIDTPGVIPAEGGELEALIRGTPIDELEDPVRAAALLIKRVLEENPRAFFSAYGIEGQDPVKIMEDLAAKRGWFYKKTKEPLIEEAAKQIIRDFHDGVIEFYIDPRKHRELEGWPGWGSG